MTENDPIEALRRLTEAIGATGETAANLVEAMRRLADEMRRATAALQAQTRVTLPAEFEPEHPAARHFRRMHSDDLVAALRVRRENTGRLDLRVVVGPCCGDEHELDGSQILGLPVVWDPTLPGGPEVRFADPEAAARRRREESAARHWLGSARLG